MKPGHLESTKEACLTALADSEMKAVAEVLARAGHDERAVVNAVQSTARQKYAEAVWEPLLEACVRAGFSEDAIALQRWALLQTIKWFVDRVPSCPVAEAVKDLLLEEYCYVARPGKGFRNVFSLRGNGFRAFCQLAILERFPAGQSHWIVDGFPRSWIAKAPLADVPRLAFFLTVRMKGVRPYFVGHRAPRWPPVVLEREAEKSLCLIAKSMELQPAIRGFMGSSWLNDPALAAISPHLGWIAAQGLDNGALLTTVGPSPDDAGFLSGNDRRRQLYESGEWRPQVGVKLWPRQAMIAWARSRESDLAGV